MPTDPKGETADLVFVFFDPMGQALCKRTLDIVETLHQNNSVNQQKIFFYLSKADTIEKDTDRQKVIVQITQNLCRRQAVNSVAFEIPTIYIPRDDSDPITARVPNEIGQLCGQIDKTINFVVQNTLNQFENDCKKLLTAIENRIKESQKARDRKCSRIMHGVGQLFFGLLLVTMGLGALVATLAPQKTMDVPGNSPALRACGVALTFFNTVFFFTGESMVRHMAAVWIYGLISFLVVYRGFWSIFNRGAALSNTQMRDLALDRRTITKVLENNFNSLYADYLGDAVGEDRERII